MMENDIIENPFQGMSIADYSCLKKITERSPCTKCGKSRKYFCYTCYIPVEKIKDVIPKISLPIKIDIIKHKNETDGKSTAVHAALLAPDDVKIYTYPDILDYTKENNTILVFPSSNCQTVSQLFNKEIQTINEQIEFCQKGYNIGTLLKNRLQEYQPENCLKNQIDDLPITKAVFIDSTWNQSRGIFKDKRIKSMKSIILQNRISQFWRYQSGCPRWYLATIEAIHQLLLEIHITAWGLNRNYRGLDNLGICMNFGKNQSTYINDKRNHDSYNGQYDNLLYFFAYMYDLIHAYYDHNKLKSYQRTF